jgi:hypothetical protein
MASNNPRPPKRSWRDGGSPGKGPSPGPRKWQKESESKGPGGPRLGRGTKIALAALALVIVGVGIKIVIDWLKPPTPFTLVLVEADYATNLAIPPNVPGRRAVEDLQAWARDYSEKQWAGDKDKGIDARRITLTAEEDVIGKALKDCKSPTVVVFLAVHGGADARGAYLVPNGAGLQDRDNLYRLSKVLDALAGLPGKTRKLLVVDTTGVEAILPLGMLHNHFVAALRSEVERRADPNLLVMAASAENQTSWASEDFGQTAFAHYFLEGLRGAADKDHQGSVTVQKLFDYVSGEVERWARHNREALQTPILLGKKDLAADMEVVRLTGNYEPRNLTPPLDWTRTPLLKEWEQRDRLEKAAHPATFAPLQWRQYQDVLLRYEALLRYGDEANASRLEDSLKKLKGQIEEAKQRESKALTNSLAMPTALGWPVAGKEAQVVSEPFERLWNEGKSAKEFEQQLGAILNGAGISNVQSQLRRGRLDSLLLEKARGSEKDFVRACEILRALGDSPTALRPAEAHFALMVDHVFTRYLEKSWDWPTLQLALAVRGRAEAAALGLKEGVGVAYSERVLPWTRSQVEEADRLRRRGEDLLFGSPREVQEGQTALKQAEKLYEEAQARAEKVRTALLTRDRALAELPYHGYWLMRQASEDKINAYETLWEKVRDLTARLAEPRPDEVDVLKDQAQAIGEGLVKLAGDFRESVQDERGGSALQKNWHEIDALLTAPFIPPQRRLQLLEDERRIGTRLFAEMDKAESPPGVTAEKADQETRQSAWRTGKVALAGLGANALTSQERKATAALLERWKETSWWDPFGSAGDSLGEGQRRLAEGARKGSEDARKAILEKAGPLASAAARQARCLDGAALRWLGTDPVNEERALQLHELLTWQARRSYLDFWASENPNQPYFRAAGSLYLEDSLVGLSDVQKNGRPDAELVLEKNVREVPDAVVLRLLRAERLRAGRLHLTDEPNVSLAFEAAATGVVPEGRPVVWAKVGRWVELKPEQEGRTALTKVGPDLEKATKTYDVHPKRSIDPNFLQGDTDFTAHLVFRGRHQTCETPIRMHYRPDLTLAQPTMPPDGRIVVQADRNTFNQFATDNTELVIAFDCSGSMGNKRKGATEPKLTEALQALRQCLNKVPDGVHVSLLTFTAPNYRPEVEIVWNRMPWQRARLVRLMDELEGDCWKKVKKEGFTPLVNATWKASQLFRGSVAKTLIVITDGGDNTYNTNNERELYREGKGGKNVKDFLLKNFEDSDVQINLIKFDATGLDRDEQEGKEQYEDALRQLRGNLVDARDGAELASQMERFFLQIRFWVDPDLGEGRPQPKNVLYPVSLIDENFYQKTAHVEAPWPWWVRLQASDKKRNIVQQLVSVGAGDRLVLDLVSAPDGRGFALRRDLYAKRRSLLPPENPRDTNWYLAVQQNQPGTLTDSLHLMTTLELDAPAGVREKVVRQFRPQLAWFRVAPKGQPDQAPAGQRIAPLLGYPAPAYGIDLARWMPGQTPVLDAWWVESRDKLVSAVGRDLQQGRDFGTLKDLKEKDFDAWLVPNEIKQKVVVESVAIEPKRRIEYKPGDWQERECLVVRLRYEDGKTPYFAQLPGTLAEEHNFYNEAGKYVGVFVLAPGQRAEELPALHLVSVEAARRVAVHLEKPLDLGPPDRTKGRPAPWGNDRD